MAIFGNFEHSKSSYCLICRVSPRFLLFSGTKTLISNHKRGSKECYFWLPDKNVHFKGYSPSHPQKWPTVCCQMVFFSKIICDVQVSPNSGRSPEHRRSSSSLALKALNKARRALFRGFEALFMRFS